MSIVTFEKPDEHVALADWHGRLWELRQTAETRHHDAYELRNRAQQLRNEADCKTRWDAYHNNARLADRAGEVGKWKRVLAGCLDRVNDEIRKLTEERAVSGGVLESTVNTPLAVVSDCMRIRDGRHGNDLNHDETFAELANELQVIETLKKTLVGKQQAAWEQLTRLEQTAARLQLDLDNKRECLQGDRTCLEMGDDCAGTSYKPDPLRIPPDCMPYASWLDFSRYNKLSADNEIAASVKLREAMYCSRERALTDMRVQYSATDAALRRRLYETRRISTALEWQREKMLAEMTRLEGEVGRLGDAVRGKTNALKLAETRLELRLMRPGAELVHDEPQVGLGEQVLQLRQTTADLRRQLDCANGTYNALEHHLVRIMEDLANKRHALDTDLKCAESRLAGFNARARPTQTDTNVVLTRMEDMVPPT